MKVEELTRRLIKPAYRDHYPNIHLILNNMDLAMMPGHVFALFAFQAPAPPTSVLEEGLSKVLVDFREWAGRFGNDENGRPSIHLNDEGVVVIEAQANAILADVSPFNQDDQFLFQLLPPARGVPEPLLFQFTRFACGGLVMGTASHHHISDGTANGIFLNAWSQTVRGQPIHPAPIHDRSVLMARDPPRPVFDHIEHMSSNPPSVVPVEPGADHLAMKTIHFDTGFLKRLKKSANQISAEKQKEYSTFESLLAHVWKCITKARSLPGEVVTRVKFSVDARKRLNPPIPAEYFGNVIFPACPQTTVKQLMDQPLEYAASLVRNAIARLDDEYIRSAIDSMELNRENSVPIARVTGETALNPNVGVTSWVNVPIYELDFGWGKPVYAGPVLFPIEGLSIFTSSTSNDGSIDVLMALLESDMSTFQEICYST